MCCSLLASLIDKIASQSPAVVRVSFSQSFGHRLNELFDGRRWEFSDFATKNRQRYRKDVRWVGNGYHRNTPLLCG